MSIPADIESNMPSTTNALGLFALYTDEIPAPTAIPIGVVIAKKHAISIAEKFLNCACNDNVVSIC